MCCSHDLLHQAWQSNSPSTLDHPSELCLAIWRSPDYSAYKMQIIMPCCCTFSSQMGICANTKEVDPLSNGVPTCSQKTPVRPMQHLCKLSRAKKDRPNMAREVAEMRQSHPLGLDSTVAKPETLRNPRIAGNPTAVPIIAMFSWHVMAILSLLLSLSLSLLFCL